MVPTRSVDFIDLLTLSRASRNFLAGFKVYHVIHFKPSQKVLTNLFDHLYYHRLTYITIETVTTNVSKLN